MVRRLRVALLLFAPFACPAQAQTAKPEAATVSGHVTCADTNGPARFARVLLKSTAPAGDPFADMMKAMGGDEKSASSAKAPAKPDTPEEKALKEKMSAMMNKAADIAHSTTVAVDGSYTFTNVAPGTYYIHATYPGYIDPLAQFSDADLTSKDPAIRARIAAQTQTITIAGGESPRADLTLQRGGAISGRILFDDGLPASGWVVKTVDPKAKDDGSDPFSQMMQVSLQMSGGAAITTATTDDQGHFRIAGLSSGDYALQATLTATGLGHSGFNAVNSDPESAMANLTGPPAGTIHLTVYSGNTLRLAEAKPISVRAGDETTNTDLTMPLRTLHTLTGRVVAKTGGHPVNAGLVDLTGKDDTSIHIVATIQPDGTFHFDYVPTGTYTVATKNAHDTVTAGIQQIFGQTINKQKTLHTYGPATAEVLLQDTDAEQTLTVPDAPKPGDPKQ